jgi:hypothetical protein
MPEPYNLSGLQNSGDLLTLTQQTNIIADGLLGFILLIILWFVLFIAFKTYDVKRALAGSSFICSIIAIFLRLLSLITDQVMFGMFIIAAISFILIKWGGD